MEPCSPKLLLLMRVIAGKFRRRPLLSLDGGQTRPILGRMRQRLFDILQGSVEGCVFADLYAGTGAVGIEALSRGADRAIFVESSPKAAGVIRRNLSSLGVRNQGHVRVARVRNVIDRIRADIYFLGPPYSAHREYFRTMRALAGRPAEWVIAQHPKTLDLPDSFGPLARERVVRVGQSRISMYSPR